MMKVAPDDRAARAPHELRRRLRRAARCDQVVDDQDALALADRVLVHLDHVDTVFQRVLLADGLPRQLAFLADRHEAAPEPVGDGPAQDEPARLDADHRIDGLRAEGLRHLCNSRLEALCIAQERGHVPEHDPGLGVIRDSTYQAF